jgi:SAM-dependent methyltransferase
VTQSGYDRIRAALAASYGDDGAERRDALSKADWKVAERAAFLRRLQDAGCRTLLEIGAGTGQDSLFFAGRGMDVLATDLSPAMVARCREKGLAARILDFSQPDLEPESFDAVHAMNCLLHVPNSDLPAVLAAIAGLLRPGGLLFLGVYGGDGSEGVHAGDDYVPPRFFSWRTDEQIQDYARQQFEILDFHVVHRPDGLHFQSLTLRRPTRTVL